MTRSGLEASRREEQDRLEPIQRRVDELIQLYGSPQASVAQLLCDGNPPDNVAFRFVEQDLSYRDMTYGELRARSERFAAALWGIGVGPGDRVATLMGKTPDFVVAALAIWRLGAVQVPLFTAFAWPAIELRLNASHARVLICDSDQRAKVSESTSDSFRVISGCGNGDRGSGLLREGDLDFFELLESAPQGFPAAALGGDAPMIHIFTSGTTGRPKGVVMPTRALATCTTYLEFSVDVRSDDRYWNAADPGWAYGLFCAILAPMCEGVTSLLLNSGFSAQLTADVLGRFGVTNLAAAPTVYRSLRASGLERPAGLKLRCASSAGEPLTPEVNQWAREWLGVDVFDHYGQTEAGMMVCNHHHPDLRSPLREGSMGRDLPGWRTVVLEPDRDVPAPAGELGRLAVDLRGSPLAWFEGYDGERDRSSEKFSPDGRWYLTGDTARRDEDNFVYFSARDDDVIIMAGYRIGPIEIESVLMKHPAVAECAVIAVPDAVRGEVMEAFITLGPALKPSAELERELQQLVKTSYAAHAYPRRVHFVESLPKTPSGKVQRYLLREQRRNENVNSGG